MSPPTRSCTLHPYTYYIIGKFHEVTYHDKPLLHPSSPTLVDASYDLPPPHPKLVVFRYSKGPSSPPLGGPSRPPTTPPNSLDPCIIMFHRPPPPPQDD